MNLSSWTAKQGLELCSLMSHQLRAWLQLLVSGLCIHNTGESCVAVMDANPSGPCSQNGCSPSTHFYSGFLLPLVTPEPSSALLYTLRHFCPPSWIETNITPCQGKLHWWLHLFCSIRAQPGHPCLLERGK